jgi:serine/threonine-protein phosphatase with EF-hand domain
VHKLLRHSYKKLKKLPNTTSIYINQPKTTFGHRVVDEKVTVVGDIHGQLYDLLHILDEAGMPSLKHKYVFNGDFVDRGPYGVEVMCILMALFNAFPESVVLNRGNHEDFPICCAYGFQVECYEKYNESTFGMFCEVFRQLPLFAIVNNGVLILHGGLFHNRDVRLCDLNEIDRTNFNLREASDPALLASHEPDSSAGLSRQEYLNLLQRDALWSDPQSRKGIDFNPRGAGISFGPDVVDAFLSRNNLKLVIRSHECVNTGFDIPFLASGKITICTLFSASNYGGVVGTNDGAYLQLVATEENESATNIADTHLSFNVFRYNILPESSSKIEADMPSSGLNLHRLLLSKVTILQRAFVAADIDGSELIAIDTWSTILSTVTKIKIRWPAMVHRFVPEEAVVGLYINYALFLSALSSSFDDEFQEVPVFFYLLIFILYA